MPCHAIPYHTIPYHTMPCHAMPYHTKPNHTIPNHIMYHTIPYHTMLYRTIPYHGILYHITLHHTIPYYSTPYHTPYIVIPYLRIVPYHTTSCHTISNCTIPKAYYSKPYHSKPFYSQLCPYHIIPNYIFMANLMSLSLQEMAKVNQKPTTAPAKPPASGGDPSLKAHDIFKELADRLVSMPNLAKRIKATYLWNVTKDGKTAGQWFVDLKTGSGSITAGAPTGKADCTITVADDDLAKIVSGKANAQQLFMTGKLKIGGNIMLTQKLGDLLKSQAKLWRDYNERHAEAWLHKNSSD